MESITAIGFSLFEARVRDIAHGDLPALEKILQQHVRDRATGKVIDAEVEAILQQMQGAPDAEGRSRKYFIATDGHGFVIGCAAISRPDEDMQKHFNVGPTNAFELLNVFVNESHIQRRCGVGKALFDRVCTEARSRGARLLLVNSGTRYEKSWGFYDHVCDRSAGFIENKYGVNRHAKTWSKDLC